MNIAGLDIGSTGCKIVVYNENGTELFHAYREYENAGLSVYEADGAEIWKCVKELLCEAAADSPEISAIGVASFGESFVMLDENDKPLQSVLLYTHPGGEEECAFLSEKLTAKRIFEITGANPKALYTLPKLMWVKKNSPEIFEKARRVLTMQDYITYMLTGVAQMDYSQSARTLAADIYNHVWSDEILNAAGIDKALFANLVPAGTVAGRIFPPVLQELSQFGSALNNCRIVTACHDQIAAATGAGAINLGEAVDGAGTVQCVTPVFDKISNADNMLKSCFSIIPHVQPGLFGTYAFTFSGGALLKWYRDELARERYEAAKAAGKSIYKILDSEIRPEPSGLLVLPHFSGAATPYMDPHSKGAVVGMTLATTTRDIYQSLMEGIVYEMRLNQEYLAESGIKISKLHATGGGSMSSVWLQMKADILRLPIVSLANKEAGTAGSAMLAGKAMKLFGSLREAAEQMVVYDKTFYPREEYSKKFDEVYGRYRGLYNAVRGIV